MLEPSWRTRSVCYAEGIESQPLVLKKAVSKLSTSYHGEPRAMLLATQFGKEYSSTHHITKLNIFTDCQTVIASVTSRKHHRSHQETIDQCIAKISALVEKRIVILIHWVPGHAVLAQAAKELVDGYAKEAAAEAMELNASPTSLSVVKNQIKKSTLKKWQRAWRLPENKRSLHTICPSVPVRRLKSSSSTKSQDSTWIRVIMEHNRLNDHMFRIRLSETRLCECGEAQTAAHVLIDCHLYSADREAMLCVIELSFVKCNLPIQAHS